MLVQTNRVFAETVTYISCNMGTCNLPEIYALALGLRPHACAYISGKLLVPMLQLLHIYIFYKIKLKSITIKLQT